MNATTEVQELPTLPATSVHYRNFDNGLWHGCMSPSDSRWDLAPDQLRDSGMSYSARALSVWNEAHNENARRDREALDQALIDPEIAVLRSQLDRMTEIAARQGEELQRLRDEQITGDDPRLATFWETANRLATESNQCHVYDQLSRELGGPGRSQSYAFTVNVTIPVVVIASGSDEDEAWEQIDSYDVFEAFNARDYTREELQYGGYDECEELED